MGSPCSLEPTKPAKQSRAINICYVQLAVMHADMQLLVIVQQLSAKSAVSWKIAFVVVLVTWRSCRVGMAQRHVRKL